MPTVAWLPEALDDVGRLYDFLAEKHLQAARNAIDCIQAAANILEQHPEAAEHLWAKSASRQNCALTEEELTRGRIKRLDVSIALPEEFTSRAKPLYTAADPTAYAQHSHTRPTKPKLHAPRSRRPSVPENPHSSTSVPCPADSCADRSQAKP